MLKICAHTNTHIHTSYIQLVQSYLPHNLQGEVGFLIVKFFFFNFYFLIINIIYNIYIYSYKILLDYKIFALVRKNKKQKSIFSFKKKYI